MFEVGPRVALSAYPGVQLVEWRSYHRFDHQAERSHHRPPFQVNLPRWISRDAAERLERVTGRVTINDLVNTSEAAIGWHLNESRELADFVETEAWTRQVWHRDRRFADLAPRVDATVYDVAVAGHHDDQRHLYQSLPALRERLVELTATTPSCERRAGTTT